MRSHRERECVEYKMENLFTEFWKFFSFSRQVAINPLRVIRLNDDVTYLASLLHIGELAHPSQGELLLQTCCAAGSSWLTVRNGWQLCTYGAQLQEAVPNSRLCSEVSKYSGGYVLEMRYFKESKPESSENGNIRQLTQYKGPEKNLP